MLPGSLERRIQTRPLLFAHLIIGDDFDLQLRSVWIGVHPFDDAAAACSCVLSSISFCLSTLTCASVTILQARRPVVEQTVKESAATGKSNCRQSPRDIRPPASRADALHDGMEHRLGIPDGLQKPLDDCLVNPPTHHSANVQSEQIRWRHLEVLAYRFFESTIGIVVYKSVQQMGDICEIALTFGRSIAEQSLQ